MRISRKIGLSFFITFLLVILLGALSIYSLRHVYKGLDRIFSRELPAARITYQIATSKEDIFSELNNFLITSNENFKLDYERSYREMQANISRLKDFIILEDEKAAFDSIKTLALDIDAISKAVFDNTSKAKGLIEDTVRIEIKYREGLYRLFDFEEHKMLSEKDNLLVNAQGIPASQLIIDAKTRLSSIMDRLMRYAISGAGEGREGFMNEFQALDKYIKDYKNYHGYLLSEKERAIASDLMDMTDKIKTQADGIIKLQEDTRAKMSGLYAKEKEISDALDKAVSLRKDRISANLGIGNILTEDIPAVQNISRIENNIARSWGLSGRYILTGDKAYMDSYYELRGSIEKEFKDYETYARLRGRDMFLTGILETDKEIKDSIDSDMKLFEDREAGVKEVESIKSNLIRDIEGLLSRNGLLIKEADTAGPAIASRWVLARLNSEVLDAERLVINYLANQNKAYKDLYSEIYFNMKGYVNTCRNAASSDQDALLINDIEAGLDKYNSSILKVLDAQDKIIVERGWNLIKLEDSLKANLQKETENELRQIEKNKTDIRNKISVINVVIFFIMAAVAFIAGFVILYTAKSITGPIQKLHQGAELIGKGNLDHRLDIKTGDEIEELAEGFNRMAGELQGLYTNLENKVKERTSQLAEANEALGKINKELDDFTYTVSHDLKEPLRGVKAFSKLLAEEYSDKLGGEAKEYLKTISDSSIRMARLIEDLLNLSRISRIKNIEQGVDLNEVLGDVKKNLAYGLEEKNAELVIEPDFPKVACDRVRISEVFSNLISNAVKYTKKDTQPVVEVGWSDKKDFYEFYVKDNGIGIEEQYYDKIFQIFQRLSARTEYEGTGAGLTIVKKIVENHGGKIWVESEVDAGSTFYFTLPKRYIA